MILGRFGGGSGAGASSNASNKASSIGAVQRARGDRRARSNTYCTAMHPNHFAKLLVIVLPATLILTYLMKVTSMDHMRRDAIAELYASTDETAAALPKEIHVYHSGGGGNAFSSSSCSDAERRALVRIGGRLGGPHDNFMLRSGWGEAAIAAIGAASAARAALASRCSRSPRNRSTGHYRLSSARCQISSQST